jgi:hypothetical protein
MGDKPLQARRRRPMQKAKLVVPESVAWTIGVVRKARTGILCGTVKLSRNEKQTARNQWVPQTTVA